MKVVYLDVDSLRPDHLGCYGYGRATSPHIDRLAAQGVRFTRCYASDSPCMPSRAALFSGSFGIRNGVVTHGPRAQQLHPPGPTLAGLLRTNGVRTATVSSFGRHPAPWFLVGWDEVHDPTGWGFQAVPGWAMRERAVDWLARHAAEDFFLHVHMWDAHGWRSAPECCLRALGEGTRPEYPTAEQIERHQSMVAWHSAQATGMVDRDAVDAMYDGYDAEIRYVDHQIGLILKCLADLNILDDTLVLVSADHAQEFGEHGVYFEHWSVYEGTARVPLIARYPRGVARDRVDAGLVYQLDLAATVAEAFGLAVPPAWDSRSLWQRFRAPGEAGRPHLVLGHGLYLAQRAVVRDEWKLVRTMHPGQWELPPVQLFQPLADPWEQQDQAEQRPDVVQELSALLLEWEDAHPSPGGVDPMRVNAAMGPAGVVGPAAQRALASGRAPGRRPTPPARHADMDLAAADGWWT